ncbi:MAG: hypothetical protein ACUVQ5_02725 [Candidatus Methanomethylicaceae archaeon]
MKKDKIVAEKEFIEHAIKYVLRQVKEVRKAKNRFSSRDPKGQRKPAQKPHRTPPKTTALR